MYIYICGIRRGWKEKRNNGGVKFRQASVVRGHIPAKGMCGQRVGGRHARGGVRRRSVGVDEGTSERYDVTLGQIKKKKKGLRSS